MTEVDDGVIEPLAYRIESTSESFSTGEAVTGTTVDLHITYQKLSAAETEFTRGNMRVPSGLIAVLCIYESSWILDHMEKATISEVESFVFGEESTRRGLSEHLGATELALNQYRLAPGDGLPGGLHTHIDQEEVFVVLDGTATFETMNGKVTVDEAEAIRFGPGEFQSGKNEADSELVMLALGAPRDTDDIRIPVDCPDCNHETLRLNFSDKMTFICPGCNGEHIPRNCLNCGHEDLRVTLGEGTQTVVICQNCETEFERPPLQG
ncbi:cupin domain-containing protein [Natrinema soli]|uniref:Cupin domain-containing protein n=1 Tax=Natrinema soli TaxID=1930624 RepID=A0ABD5SYT8_9EURY|nr:cupin domain-containing protein [Natrinema soli]